MTRFYNWHGVECLNPHLHERKWFSRGMFSNLAPQTYEIWLHLLKYNFLSCFCLFSLSTHFCVINAYYVRSTECSDEGEWVLWAILMKAVEGAVGGWWGPYHCGTFRHITKGQLICMSCFSLPGSSDQSFLESPHNFTCIVTWHQFPYVSSYSC